MNRLILSSLAIFLVSHIPSIRGAENVVEGVADYKKPYNLTCSKAIGDPKPVSWEFNGQPVVAKDKVYEFFEHHVLGIVSIEPSTVGAYLCRYNGTMEMAFTIKVRPHVEPFDKTRNVIQGDPLRLDCKAWGVPAPTIEWSRDGVPLVADGSHKITLKPYGGAKGEPEVQNGTIRIVDLDYPDMGNYSCFASSQINGNTLVVNATVLVQVKDKYAALWPFLGICVEVAVLCTIILIYERRRSKRIEEEERQEEAAHLNANNETRPVGGEEVRQRK